MLEIGKTFLRTSHLSKAAVEPSQAQGSVKWLQKAFSIIELSDNTETPGLAELRVGPSPPSRVVCMVLTKVSTALNPEKSRCSIIGHIACFIRSSHFIYSTSIFPDFYQRLGQPGSCRGVSERIDFLSQ